MIAPAVFLETLKGLGVSVFTGVPDSLLKSVCQHIDLNVARENHIIAANEGAAVALAMGSYMATGQPAVVYLQNSGIGNTVNPLLSLADPDVYGVPMILLVGWRGQPGVKDEPQHVKQGRVMTQLLDAMDLPWAVMPTDEAELGAALKTAVDTATRDRTPYVLLVEKDAFGKGDSAPKAEPSSLPSREEALKATVAAIGDNGVCVATTGMLGRELFEHRVNSGTSPALDFLTVGGMGHASSIALGVALKDKGGRDVWCLDGDGALLMHMGTMAVITAHAPKTFNHVIFNNGVHDSVGGQPTPTQQLDLPAIARAAGYRSATTVDSLDAIAPAIAAMRGQGPSLLEIAIKPGNRADIGRPTTSPSDARSAFMAALAQTGN
jgi:phosphonopyruvate decarboxylase